MGECLFPWKGGKCSASFLLQKGYGRNELFSFLFDFLSREIRNEGNEHFQLDGWNSASKTGRFFPSHCKFPIVLLAESN